MAAVYALRLALLRSAAATFAMFSLAVGEMRTICGAVLPLKALVLMRRRKAERRFLN
jgi:hypothetical protein